MGSFRAFMKARSQHKWLYTHRTGKWDAFYSPEVQELTRRFMDCFLKGETSNGFLDTPPVRLEVRTSRDEVHAVRDEREWPLARTDYQTLYLTDQSSLSPNCPVAASEMTYSATKGQVAFRYAFAEDTELTGYMKLRLWVEARPGQNPRDSPDDMGIFVAINKRDRRQQSVPFYGSVGNQQDRVTRGWGRASRRETDVSVNRGLHVVHLGQGFDSHLLVPQLN